MNIKQIFPAALLLCVLQARAQQELMQYSLPNLWHSNALNPAFFPHDKRIAIGLPGIALDAAHSGDVSYNDVFVKSGDRRILDLSAALPKLDPENDLFAEQRVETFSLGLRLRKKVALSIGHANRLSLAMTYPKALPELIWNGNGPYIGQTLQIAPATTMSNWNEWSAGVAIPFGKVTLGGKLKLLTGAASIVTDDDHKTATIYTNPDIYQLELKSDYAFHSSSVVSAFDTSGYGFSLKLAEFGGNTLSKNTGTAIDLGVAFSVNERISLSASVLDLGARIRWKENTNYYKSEGEYTLEGATIDLLNGSDSLGFEQKLDTLNDVFNFKKTEGDNFQTTLPTRIYVGGRFQLSQALALSLTLFHQSQAERSSSALGVGAQFLPVKWASLGVMYSVNDRKAANLGAHVVLRPGPVQLYFCSDNLLNAFSAKSKAAANLRAGLSLVF